MTAPTVNRAAVKRRLRDLIRTAPLLAGLDVELTYGPPRVPSRELSLFVGNVDGDLEVPNMKAGRKVYDDRFDVECWAVAWTPGEAENERADDLVEHLVEAVRSLLADRPTLAETDDGSGLDGVVAATLAGVDGPTGWRTGEGVGSASRMFVSVHTRIAAT